MIVKSTNHFMASYGPIAKKVIYIDSRGPLIIDYRKPPFTRVNRPLCRSTKRTAQGSSFERLRAQLSSPRRTVTVDEQRKQEIDSSTKKETRT